MPGLTMSDVQQDVATATVLDAAGNAVAADPANPNKISYALSAADATQDVSVVTLTDNGDGTCQLKAAKPGSCTLTASDSSGDAPDAEVVTITGTPGHLVIAFGAPTP